MNAKHLSRALAVLAALALLVVAGCTASQPAGPMTASDMVTGAKQHIQEVSAADARQALDQGGSLFVDVRTDKEYRMGHLPGAIHVDRGLLEFKVSNAVPDKTAHVIVYCKTGGRSALAADTLQRMGYTNVLSMARGFQGWMQAGYPVE